MYGIKRWIGCTVAIVVVAGLIGCGSSGSSSSGNRAGASMDALANQVDAEKAARKERESADAGKAAAEQKAATEQAAQNPPEQEKKVAERGKVQFGGYYGAIAGARRHIMNRVDDIAWTQGVQHFQATEGRLPKDHNEFMTKIVTPLGINLGYKEEDQEFLYDPTPTEEHPWGNVYVVGKEPAQLPPAATSAPASESK
jgi:hypothetical protein